MSPAHPLPASFYLRPTPEVARNLLGCRLIRRFSGGRTRSVVIVETEAYLGIRDRAAHTWNGRRTDRVAPMWGPGGHAYVYQIYGMHFCLNVVTQKEGVPQAVLIRAGVPEKQWLENQEPREVLLERRMEKSGGRRGLASQAVGAYSSSKKIFLVASGPGKLCKYLSITRTLSGASLSGPDLILTRGARRAFDVLVGPRVGVAYAGEAASWPLRFAVAGCAAVTQRRTLGFPVTAP